MPLSTNITENVDKFKKLLNADQSFDLIYRTIQINKKTSCLFYIDGLLKDEVMEKILEFFYSVNNEEDLKDAHMFSKRCVPYTEVDMSDDEDKICFSVFSGMLALFIDGFDKAILIDVRTYPQRSTSEPEKDKSLRGSRDGFVETIVFNTALIRRRIRSAHLTMQMLNVGKLSRTDVVLCYMDNKADKKLIKKLTDKINSLDIESITMNQQSLIEAMVDHGWYNPFPKVKYTERPDAAAASVLHGNVVILVDNSPSAMILPTSIFDIIEEAGDYYFPPITGSYLRLSRYLISLVSIFLTPVWLLLLENPQFIPPWLDFIKITEPLNVPIIWQLLLLELVIDGLRLAAVNTPTSISTTLSIIAAIVLSDFAVQSGWFNAEAMLYMAFVAMTNYSQPSFELGYALKFMRILLLILTSILNIWGFVLGIILIIALLFSNKTISGKSYLYPLIPFNGKMLIKKMFRPRLSETKN